MIDAHGKVRDMSHELSLSIVGAGGDGAVAAELVTPIEYREIFDLTAIDDTLYFATDRIEEPFVWRVASTQTTNEPAVFQGPDGDVYPGRLVAVNGTIFFTADSPDGTSQLWKSTDGGANWTVLSLAGGTRIIHEDQFAMAFKPGNPDTIYVGGDGGTVLAGTASPYGEEGIFLAAEALDGLQGKTLTVKVASCGPGPGSYEVEVVQGMAPDAAPAEAVELEMP